MLRNSLPCRSYYVIVKCVCRPGRCIIVVYDPRRRYVTPKELFQRGCRVPGVKKCNFRLKSLFMSETTPCKAIVSIVSEFIIGCQPVVHTEGDIVLPVLCVCLSVCPSVQCRYL